MKRPAALLSLAAATLSLCAAAAAPPVKPTDPRSWAPISPARMSAMVKVLASDPFEGRGPGTPGETKTIAWLAAQFRQLGLEPAGPNGSWFQTVPLVRTQLDKSGAASFSVHGQTVPLHFPGDIYLGTVRETDRARIENAPVVFVGYGVNAPERHWDDFKGVDLHGKIALFLVNDPDFEAAPGEPAAGKFGGQAMTYYGRWTYKYEEAARRGAIGALIVHETAGAGYGWNTVQAPGGESYNIVLGPRDPQPVLVQGWIQRPVAEDLFRRAGLDFETVKKQARSPDFRPIDLGARFSADFAVSSRRVESHNVLAKISGARRPDETILFGAHWDAYGIGAPDARGKRIRPGAADDGLGIAGVLEIARAFKEGPRPDRTLLFGIWTAEERGLLGSEYFSAHPLYLSEKMVADITLDTLEPLGPSRDVILIGRGQDTLEDRMARLAAAQGRTVTPDSHPERGLFYRADHFSAAKRGVPVLLLMALGAGPDLVEGGRAAGDQWVSDYTAHCYHQTCDEWRPDWDLRGAAQDVALAYAIGRELAFSRAWPDWKPGSEFRPIRERSAAARR
ncbi:MAG TPA: M28 family metallopeptidase [Allosphingosinicella sp.]|jgi:Zn-dependent M28 family amino/carboxypeptidase|nr:M28 family metallopeptidase [Allosphingosinicella sp.]